MNKRRYPARRAAPWQVAGCVTAVVLLVAGCTSSSADGGTTGSSTSVSSSAPTPSVASVPPTPSAVDGTRNPTSTPIVPTRSEPWPPNFTAEQQANVLAAISVFSNYAETVNSAQQDPAAKDWTAPIRKFAADPTAQVLIDSVKSLAQGRVHQIGSVLYSDTHATETVANKVTLVACVDQSSVEFRDQDGRPVALPNQAQRYTTTASVYYFGPKVGWLVSEVSQIDESKSC